MKKLFSPSLLVVLGALLLAAGFLSWVTTARRERVEYVSQLGAEEMAVDPHSPTGWAGKRRWLIASEHNNASYQWIMETQQMLASGQWRLHEVDYDNAPERRQIGTAAPYRWWLAGVARLIEFRTGVSRPLSVERAALLADPLALVLGWLTLALIVGRAWGAWPAAVLITAGAIAYPFSAAFAPGAPDHLVLTLLAGLTGLLALAAALLHQAERARATRWAIVAGVAGGFGLWVNAFSQGPVLLGSALAGLLALVLKPADGGAASARVWRTWAVAGALASVAAYAVEFGFALPGHEIRANHPFLALGWLAAGELLAVLAVARGAGRAAVGRGGWIRGGIAAAALVGLAVLIAKTDVPWVQGREVFGTRLTSLPLAGAAPSLGLWLAQEGLSLQVLAVLAPLALLVVPLGLIFRPATGAAPRAALVVAVAPLFVLFPLACVQLRWWAMLDAAVIVAVVLTIVVLAASPRRAWLAGAVALCLLPALLFQRPVPRAKYENELTQFEVEGIVERSLAHWLPVHSATPPQVLAPPFRTTALAYFGSLRALGSLMWENKDAMNAAARIASATSPDEALALVNKRGVTHIIMPSWDGYLEEYARIFTSRPETSFVYALKQWSPPLWLRPVAYQLPTIGGFDGQSVFIWEVTDEQDQATALSRMVEYFIEMGQLDLATSATRGLESYPTNLTALVTRAQFHASRGEAGPFGAALATLRTVYDSSEEHDLAWDRRVSLAVVLMQANQAELARREMEICLNLADEGKLRTLSVGSLYRFQVLLHALNLKIEDPKLAALASELLPPSLRSRL